MPNTRQIRRRIRSVQNTAKITKAMEMIAASKMRRAQQRVLAARPYADKLLEFLGDLATHHRGIEGRELHPLLEVRETQRIAVLQVTPDRGLCGGLNANLNRTAAQFVLQQTVPVSFIAVGRKGRDFLSRYGRDLRAEFIALGDFPSPLDVAPITTVVLQDYTSGAADRVYLIYSQFINTAVQRPVIRQLLPVEPPVGAAGPPISGDFEYEPDPATVLGGLLPRYVELLIYHALLENAASEQSARMVAMRNATDSAGEMIESLTLAYNKARQEAITRELLDLVGGVEALGKEG